MAGGIIKQSNTSNADYQREMEGDMSAALKLHERLVAYTHLVAGDSETRSGVWCEHSYARARDGAGAGAGAVAEVRELLVAAPPPASAAPLDVERVQRDVAAPLPGDDADETDPDADADADDEAGDWEGRVGGQAPSAAHRRLADAALDALREMTLARLAGAGRAAGATLRREQARVAARRLRRALAPMWAAGGARAASWLHSALCAALPRRQRALYDEVLAELRRSVPRLAERFTPHLPPVPPDPLEPPDADPAAARGDALLVWVGAGGAADERWLRRLRALVPTRSLSAEPPGLGRAAPDRWCASAAATARTRLADALADAGAGSRFVVLGGVGAGAALCAALAAGGGGGSGGGGGGGGGGAQGPKPRALLLLAPPLLTAEGARDEPDDVLHELRLPMLVVAGGGGAACGRGAAAALASRPPRRLLVIGGADDALRLPSALRRRLRLPQHALDAAIADECARWVREVARGKHERSANTELAKGLGSSQETETEEDEYAHLSMTTSRPAGTRVVTRVSGGTPLPLSAPRRAEQLDAAAILQLPIVFADDDPPALAPLSSAHAAPAPSMSNASTADGSLTVRSGARRGKFTRVIVARRGMPRPSLRATARPPLRGVHARHVPRTPTS
ncbi:unnamed protein product, partial [Iphiclides podalirius]